MKRILSIIVFVFIAYSCGINKLANGDYAYKNMSYFQAAKAYKEILNTKQDKSLYSKIGYCYLKMNQIPSAIEWYQKSIESKTYNDEDLLNFASCLIQSGEIEKANLLINDFETTHAGDARADILKKTISLFNENSMNKGDWNVMLLDFDAGKSQFSPTYYDKGIVFCSTSDDNSQAAWDGKPYLNLFHAKFASNGGFESIHTLGSNINSIFNEGPAVFSSGNSKVFFTRNNIAKGKIKKNKNDESSLRIFSAEFNGDDWNNITVLPFSSEQFNCTHPALSHDEQFLYFSSDMPGGYGGFDLYKIKLGSSGEVVPENLGPDVNGPGNEIFPTINYNESTNQEYLYFSSDMKPGFGGLDVYYVDLQKTSEVEHASYPVNSNSDDFGLIFINNSDSGYFSSSRNNNEGLDHIYKYSRIRQRYFLKGNVKNKTDQTPIPGAEVLIVQVNGNDQHTITTDDQGNFILQIDTNENFQLEAKKAQYFKGHAQANSFGLTKSDTVEVELLLEQIVLNKSIRLDNIYYDYNKWDIRTDAAMELDKMVKIMQENPEINIELSSHTDVRGNDKFNLDLSQKRAQSAVDYIISKGIDKTRIYAKGYGETMVLNRCKNKIKCSEEEHQLNRRTEFKVVKINN